VPWHHHIASVNRRTVGHQSQIITTEKVGNTSGALFNRWERFTRTATWAGEFFHQCIHPGNQLCSEPDENYFSHYSWLARDPKLPTKYRADIDWFREVTWKNNAGKMITKHQYFGHINPDGAQVYTQGGPFNRCSLYDPDSTIRQVQVVFLENTPLSASAGRKTLMVVPARREGLLLQAYYPSQMVDATIWETQAANHIQSYPPCTLQGRNDLTLLDTAGILAVRRWIFHGQKMPGWLVRTMLVKDQVAFYGGVMIKYVWLSLQQFE
jgi:hypothetical protein